MTIEQFQDRPLAHYSYAIISEGKMALMDPTRDPMQYYLYAEQHNAKIVAVFETHPHADFVSGHLQIHKETGATVYVSKLVGANYPHQPFDDGDSVQLGNVALSAIHTPGHSPDAITIIAKDGGGRHAMFTGDTLFIGDIGRPDLRERAGKLKAKREELAKMMYHTLQTKFNHLPDDTLVYPAHGAGSLCGKNLSADPSSTLGQERMGNWAFKEQTQAEFVDRILRDQPCIPSYFGHAVDINKKGAANCGESVANVPLLIGVNGLPKGVLIIDVRDAGDYKENHLPGSVNIMARSEDDKLETWLGTVVRPGEDFYVIVNSATEKRNIVERIAKIGYEDQILGVCTLSRGRFGRSDVLDLEGFKEAMAQYTILDIRNESELAQDRYFENAINIPLPELRDSMERIPRDKPIVVHCAGGYRSAVGSSLVGNFLGQQVQVFDLGDHIQDFKK